MAFDLGKFVSIVQSVAPIALAFVPAAAPFADVITNGIKEAQEIPGATGADKKAHVMNLVQEAALAADAAKPGSVDPATLAAKVSPVIDVIVDASKALHAIEQSAPASLGSS